ncbi:MAG: DUF4105 domain-containing protein, partial [Bdellovibrionales bacterium]|nr:DUF4105 domain-containing protein [Bdellovibrionales bacterium]
MCYYFRHFTYSAIFSIQIPAWILALFASVPSAAQDNIMVKFEANSVNEQQLTELAYSPAWLRLIHYQGNGTSFQSELDGQGFFLAPDGKTNPLAELKANLAAFSQEEGRLLTQFKLHPQCAFPERFRLVQSSLNISLKIKDCPLYESFLKRFHGPTGVSLVFSSAYPNNPGSMFGHTFLKIRSQRKNPLLDTGINFAAWTPRGVNMLAFMYLGVFGGYRGLWSADPYFKKVNEYINSESRDLWEYKLTLNPEETRRLVAHFWELEMNSHFDYYFFDKNCSYQILRAIEAIRTDWDLTPYRIYVIPGETVKQVGAVPNTIREVNFRPSLFHQLETSYNYLNKKERAEYQLLVQGKKMTESPASVNALDAALLGLLFRKAKLKKKWTSADQEIEDSVLQQRSQQPEKSAEVELPRHYLRSRPDLGHDSYSLQIGGGYRERPEAPSISNS